MGILDSIIGAFTQANGAATTAVNNFTGGGNQDNQGSGSSSSTPTAPVQQQSNDTRGWGSQVMDAVETSAPIAAIRSTFGTSPLFSKTPSKPQNDGGVTYGSTDEYAEADAAVSAKDNTPTSKQGTTSKKESSDDVSGGTADKIVEQTGEITANWIEPQSSRPGYRKVEDLGLDRKTYSLMSEGYTPLQAVTQRLEEETNPRIRRELDWQQGQLLQNKIEVSSDYHHWGMDTGRPVSVNPFENQGDMALAIKEGTRQEGKLQISRSNPGVLGVMQALPEKDYVPGGMGWGDITWMNAKSEYQTKSPSLQKAINEMESKAGNLGVYGGLNPDRDYTAWNKSHPNASVSSLSPMDILYGQTRTKRVPAKADLNYLGIKDRSAASIGAFGSKPKLQKPHKKKGNTYTPSHKDLDDKMNDILFGNNTPRSNVKKQRISKPAKESTMLQEMGLVQKQNRTKKPIQKSGKNQTKKSGKNQMFWGI